MTPIVVVDDQASNRRIISKLAQSVSDDAKVVAFADPVLALKYMESNTPELVVTDYKMEPIDGAEFIRRFRQLPACSDVPTMVITVYEDVAFRDSAMRAGSSDFLLSPIDHEDFRRRSRDLLAAHRARQTARVPETRAALSDRRVTPEAERFLEGESDMITSMLQTVNTHLVATLAELELTKSDLDIMAAESKIAVAFVDRSMKLQRFSPGFRAITNPRGPTDSLLAATIAKLGYRQLEEDFQRAIETRESVQRYIEAPNRGVHYRVKVLPRPVAGGIIDGAAIMFTKVGAWSAGHS